MKTVAVSGGFDPLHIGHIRMFEEARKLGDRLVVIINNDNWIKKKKGYVFFSEQERKELIKALRCVDDAVLTSHSPDSQDISVCETLAAVKPDIFANGGDRKSDNVPEVAMCNEMGIELVWNVGGGKVQSSSEAVTKASTRNL